MSPEAVLLRSAQLKTEMALAQLSIHLRRSGLPPQEFSEGAREAMIQEALRIEKAREELI